MYIYLTLSHTWLNSYSSYATSCWRRDWRRQSYRRGRHENAISVNSSFSTTQSARRCQLHGCNAWKFTAEHKRKMLYSNEEMSSGDKKLWLFQRWLSIAWRCSFWSILISNRVLVNTRCCLSLRRVFPRKTFPLCLYRTACAENVTFCAVTQSATTLKPFNGDVT